MKAAEADRRCPSPCGQGEGHRRSEPLPLRLKVCPGCHRRRQAVFPGNVRGQVQYGPRFQGLAVYLNVAQFLPFKRVSDVLETLSDQRPREGTLALHLNLATQGLAGFEAGLKEALLEEPVLHVDETGSKVKGWTGPVLWTKRTGDSAQGGCTPRGGAVGWPHRWANSSGVRYAREERGLVLL
ncbi:IS66 family transposase [Deinococcus hopiensis]|uniref:IS66 family transposase n=1 Tax=Deinococcus hopiensis TaxID=309885 RepID=UPI000A060363